MLSERQRRFAERAWWVLIYGAAVLLAVDQTNSWRGWLVVVGLSLMAGMYAASESA